MPGTPIFALRQSLLRRTIAYNKARLGPPGSCLDFLMFGKCMAPGYSYKHNAAVKIEPAQAEKAHQSMHIAYEAYKLENPGT